MSALSSARSDHHEDPAILRPGHNCWRIEEAGRVAFLVDGAAYFEAFREAAKQARRSLLIVGWDVNSRFRLAPDDPGDGLPVRLGEFLDALARRREELEIHVLNWDYPMLYAPDREWLPVYKLGHATHPRLHYQADDHHPAGGSQHQKVVVVDDRVAFVGGLDFTLGRWDTPAHEPGDERRRMVEDEVPQPYHDLEMMVDGAAARALGDLARERWHKASGETLEPPQPPADHDPWPDHVEPDLADVAVAISRTLPPYRDQAEVREAERLLLDAIAAARHTIYLENQYFTAHSVGDALAERLAEDDGPEVILVLPQWTNGWLSQNTMDVLRERLLKHLSDADRHHRLHVYHPHIPGLMERDQCLNVHAKVVVVDDALLRVGSTNLNHRSMGLDSECDLAIESGSKARVAHVIADLRNRLVAEHLDTTPALVADTIARQGSLAAAIDTLKGSGRSLRPFEFQVSEEQDAMVPDAHIADPETPIAADELARRLVVDGDRGPAQRAILALAGVLIAALLLAAAWRWTPLGGWVDVNATLAWLATLQGSWVAPLVVAVLYVVAGLVVFPITLLIIATGVTFGAGYGFVYALVGAELAALAGFLVGHRVGHRTVRRLSERWVARVSRRLARQGLLAVITLRVVPVAPFTVVNLVAGASHIRLRDFALGTLIGMAPGTLALTVFSDQVVEAIAAPGTLRLAGLLVLALAIGLGTWAFSRWLLARQHRGMEPRGGRRDS